MAAANIDASPLSDAEVMRAYQGQAQAAGGVRFLQAPLLFVSSLCVKKPSRLQGLLMGMTGAWLVSAVAQRRRRRQWVQHNKPVPNHMQHPTQRPTLRWVLQLLEGMHRVRVTGQGHVHDLIEGLNEVQITILRLFGEGVWRLYQISPG
jgi:transposase